MAENIREHSCPNCGGPLGIPHEHERFFKCEYCGTVLEDRASREERETGVFKINISQEDLSPVSHAELPTYSAPQGARSLSPGRATAAGRRLGCLIAAAVVLIVGGSLAVSAVPALVATGVIAQVFRTMGLGEEDGGGTADPSGDIFGLGEVRLYSFGAAAMLPSDDDTTPDIAGVASASDGTDRLVYIDMEGDPPLRWAAQLADGAAGSVHDQFLADGARLYFSTGEHILAFNREAGVQLWEAALADEIQHNICSGCFQLFGDTIVSLSAGGVLEAWESGTGARLWEVALSETPRQIVPFGGNPGVLERVAGAVRFVVFSLSGGSQVEAFAPACPNEPFPDSPQEMGIYDLMLEAAGGEGAYFFTGIFDPGCVQLWEPGGTEAAWTATFPADLARQLDHRQVTLTQDALFMAASGGVYAVDLPEGAFRVLHEDDDYDFAPLAHRDGVLVVKAERTRRTRRWELWGLDSTLGNVKWTFQPDAADYFDYESHPLNAEGAWDAGLTRDGITVVQMYDEPPRFVFQTIPLLSGTATEPVVFHISNAPGGHWIHILGWRAGEFWVVEDTNLFVIDPASGEALARWP